MVCSLYDSADIVFSTGAYCNNNDKIFFQPYNNWEPSSSKTNSPFTLRCTDDREPNVVIISNPFNVQAPTTYTYSPQLTNPIPWYIEDPISTYMSFYVIPTGAASLPN